MKSNKIKKATSVLAAVLIATTSSMTAFADEITTIMPEQEEVVEVNELTEEGEIIEEVFEEDIPALEEEEITENASVESEEMAEETTDSEGNEEKTVEELTQDFLDSLSTTSNFVIYADTFNQNCHIDGNIAVNELTTNPEIDWENSTWNPDTNSMDYSYTDVTPDTVECLKKGGRDNDIEGLDNYSIIYDGNGLKYGSVDYDAVIVSGNLGAENLNGNSVLVDITDDLSNAETTDEKLNVVADAVVNAQGENITEEEKAEMHDRVLKEADIKGNLEKIANTAEALHSELAKKDDINGKDAVLAVLNNMDVINSETVIGINAHVDELNEDGEESLAKCIDRLLLANSEIGAKIILNVVYKEDDTAISIMRPINGNQPYDKSTSYLLWNYGAFAGTVSYHAATEGIIVAPNAIVNTVVTDGRVIADKVNQGLGQEIHQPEISKEDIPETVEEPSDDNEDEEDVEEPDDDDEDTEDEEEPGDDNEDEEDEEEPGDDNEDEEDVEEPDDDNEDEEDEEKPGDDEEDEEDVENPDDEDEDTEDEEEPDDDEEDEEDVEEPDDDNEDEENVQELPEDREAEDDSPDEPETEGNDEEDNDVIEEEPISPDENDIENNTPDEETTNVTSTPVTGDNDNMDVWAALMGLTTGALGLLAVLNKKFKDGKKEN